MTKPCISIIVPVYNVDRYIETCVTSIIDQTFKNFELILVNDKTPCRSVEIARKLLKNSTINYKIIERETNGGLGAARNSGIRQASGDYLFFLDSDDWLGKEALQQLVTIAEQENPDIIVCDYYLAYNQFAYPARIFRNNNGDSREFVLQHNPCAWNKLYRKYLIAENNIYFPEDRQWYEDVSTTPLIVAKSKKLVILNKPLIYYRQREDSIMGLTREGNPKLFDIFSSVERLIINRRSFKREEWIAMEENLVFHAGAARLDDIINIGNFWKRLKFIKHLYQKLEKTFPNWKASYAVKEHHNNYRGKLRNQYKKTFKAFTEGKLLLAAVNSYRIKKNIDNRQKLLFAIPTLNIGGAEKVLSNLLNYLDFDRYNVTLYVHEQTGPLEKLLPLKSIQIVYGNPPIDKLYCNQIGRVILSRSYSLKEKYLKMRMSLYRKLAGSTRAYAKFIKPHKELPYPAYDTAISYTDLTPSMLEFIINESNSGNKIVWIHNDFNPEALDYIDEPLFLNLYRQFDNVICVSSGAAESLTNRFPEIRKKISVINNVIDAKEIHTKSREGKNNDKTEEIITLISVSRITFAPKGYDRAIPVMAKLKSEGFNFKWQIIGGGPDLEKLEQLIEHYDLKNTVVLIGPTLNPYPHIKNADALLLISHFEAYPTVVLEAHILGTPVIVCQNAGTSDQFRNVSNLVLENTDEAIYKGLKEYLTSQVLRATMKAELMSYTYDNENIIKQHNNVFDSVTIKADQIIP